MAALKNRLVICSLFLWVFLCTTAVYADTTELTAAQWMGKGREYQASKDFTNAIFSYSQAIQQDSQLTNAYVERGKLYLTMYKYDLALADFSKSIELNPKVGAFYFLRGLAYAGKWDHVSAIAEYNKTLQLEPTMYIAYWSSAISNERLGIMQAAIEGYRNFIKYASPNNPMVEEAKNRLEELVAWDKARIEASKKAAAGVRDNQGEEFVNYKKMDYIAVLFDKLRWNIGFNQETDKGSIFEFVTNNETVENWTELVTVEFDTNLKSLSPEFFADSLRRYYTHMFGNKVRFAVLRVSNEDALITYQVAGQPGKEDEDTISRIIKGKNGLIFINYAVKPQMSAEQRALGINILEQSYYLERPPQNKR